MEVEFAVKNNNYNENRSYGGRDDRGMDRRDDRGGRYNNNYNNYNRRPQ